MQDQEKFARAALTAAYDLAAVGISAEDAFSGMLSELGELLELNAPAVLADRSGYFLVKNTTSHSYKERFHEIAPGKWLLAGIRHLNGAKDQPFVHTLLAFSPSREDLELLKNFARSEFSPFSPEHVSLWLNPSSPLSLELDQLGLASRRYIVGRLSEILRLPEPDRIAEVSLERVSELDEDWYQSSYAEFHQSNPELAPWVPVTDRADLAKCLDAGLLFQVSIEGKRAGIIGASQSPLLNRPAVYMTEFLLTNPFKGHGFAPAIQRKFLAALDPGYEFVWGTIDAKINPQRRPP